MFCLLSITLLSLTSTCHPPTRAHHSHTRSFNSSSATIRPDDHQRPRPLPRAGGGLGPADSVGRELDAILGGHVGVLQSDNGVGDNALLNSYVSVLGASTS